MPENRGLYPVRLTDGFGEFMTSVEETALRNLELAFAKCDKLGIKFSGMDNSLLFCTAPQFVKARQARSDRKADYNEVAFAVVKDYPDTGQVKTGGSYVDSGGF